MSRRALRRVVAGLLLILLLGAVGALYLSDRVEASTDRVKVQVMFGHIIVRVFLNCQLVSSYSQQSAGPEVLDLGYLRPDDRVSMEVFTEQETGYFTLRRSINGSEWQTLKTAGSPGKGAPYP